MRTKKRLKDNEKDVCRTKELARECSTLGTVYSARDIRVGEERNQIIIIQNKIREVETKINNLIRLSSNKKSELLSLENEFRNQPSTSKFSFR